MLPLFILGLVKDDRGSSGTASSLVDRIRRHPGVPQSFKVFRMSRQANVFSSELEWFAMSSYQHFVGKPSYLCS